MGAIALVILLNQFSMARAEETGISPAQEYERKVSPARKITPLGDSPFGESIAMFSGGTEFNATDIDIPGNNALPVTLGRHFSISDRGENGKPEQNDWFLGGFGDWDVEIPFLEGTFANSWAVDTPDSNDVYKRCSSLKRPQGSLHFLFNSYWSGTTLHIPGIGDSKILVADAAYPTPSDGQSYPWVTSGKVRLRCLATTKNGYPGEAFMALAPNGQKYYFDWAIERGASTIKARNDSSPSLPYMSARKRVYLLATRVEDRFGNWVDYSYTDDRLTGIISSDGRNIALTYTNGRISQATANGRVWQYAYSNPSGSNDGGLSIVTLPTGEKWTYQKSGAL